MPFLNAKMTQQLEKTISLSLLCIYNLTWLPLKTWRKPCRATLALQSRNCSPYGRSALPTCDDGIAHHWAHLKCTVSSSTLLLQNADRYLPSSQFLSLVVCGWYCIYHWPWTIRNGSRPAEPSWKFSKAGPVLSGIGRTWSVSRLIREDFWSDGNPMINLLVEDGV